MRVLEVLLAALLATSVGFAAVAALGALSRALSSRATSAGGTQTVDGELAAMRADAATAYAVFVPAVDVFGQPNAAAGAHEVDFYARTDDGSERWWAYRYNATASTVQRYDYAPRNGMNVLGVADRNSGAIDTGSAYPALSGVSQFAVHELQANQLTGGASAFGPLLAQAVGADATPAPLPVGFVPASGTPRADLFGGNALVELAIVTRDGEHTAHLASGTLPSGFTIHARPTFRAIVYRLDVMHRFWFGLAQKTWARIFEQVQYSYAPGGWHVWCDFQVYGAGIDGLALNDPHASYRPQEWNEATAGAFYLSTQGDLSQLNPVGCGARIPPANATPLPAPVATSPDVIDTPPPCFAQGICWPNEAPVNWAPPSPWPSSSPPPAWCATHQLSTPCGGPGGTPLPVESAPPPPTYGTPGPVPTDHEPPPGHLL